MSFYAVCHLIKYISELWMKTDVSPYIHCSILFPLSFFLENCHGQTQHGVHNGWVNTNLLFAKIEQKTTWSFNNPYGIHMKHTSNAQDNRKLTYWVMPSMINSAKGKASRKGQTDAKSNLRDHLHSTAGYFDRQITYSRLIPQEMTRYKVEYN